MEGLQNWVRSYSKDTKSVSPSFLHEITYNLRSGGDGGSVGASSALSSADSSRVLITRPPRLPTVHFYQLDPLISNGIVANFFH